MQKVIEKTQAKWAEYPIILANEGLVQLTGEEHRQPVRKVPKKPYPFMVSLI